MQTHADSFASPPCFLRATPLTILQDGYVQIHPGRRFDQHGDRPDSDPAASCGMVRPAGWNWKLPGSDHTCQSSLKLRHRQAIANMLFRKTRMNFSLPLLAVS